MNRLLALMLLAVAPVTAVFAADAAAPAATNAEAVVDKMMDPTQNASAFKDPQAFMAWSNAMADPATSAVMLKRAMDLNNYLRMMNGMMNPASMQNYMQFTDPAVAARWMGAAVDPRFLTGMMGMGMNPNMYGNWMGAPLNPQMQAAAMQMLNPNMYTNMMNVPLSPAALNTMMMPMNPQTSMNWLGAGLNPQTYGQMGQMMDPNAMMKMIPVMPGMPTMPMMVPAR
jgi:hypothetical protein